MSRMRLRGQLSPQPWALSALSPRRRKSSSMLEVDDEGGRMFLRVLIHLTMHDYPPLISGSLQLLFKHFSQRHEVLHTFKQVTLARPCSGAPLSPSLAVGGSQMAHVALGDLGEEGNGVYPQTGNLWAVTAGSAPDLSPGC